MCGSFISNGNSNQWQFKSIARYYVYVDVYAFLKNPAMPPFAAGFAAPAPEPKKKGLFGFGK